MIDPHVHCRDWNQRESCGETIEHALYVAERTGLGGIFDMPNTDPPINSMELVTRRLEDARKVQSPVFYGLYVGLTSNPKQIREAVRAYRTFFPKPGDNVGVVGLKMFAGHSVGNLGIIEEEEQQGVYQTLAEEGYEGVLAVHCEKESLLKPELWDPSRPESHCEARPPEAECESVRDQITFATKYSFPGNLHIVHASFPDSIKLVDNARKEGKIKISCGVTPHHCMLNYRAMEQKDVGILYKVNPPLRQLGASIAVLTLLKEGYVDFIETDHAPHTLEGKTKRHMSGFPGLPYYPRFLRFLEEDVGFSREEIRELTHHAINRIFGLNIPEADREPNLNLQGEYEFDVHGGFS